MMARPVKTLCPFSSICRCSWLLRCLFCLALASSPSRVVLRFCSPPYLFSRSLLNFFHVTPGLFFPLSILVVPFLSLSLTDPRYFFASFLTPLLAPFLTVSALEVPFQLFAASSPVFCLLFSCALLGRS